MWNYDIPNGQVTGDIAYKYTHRNDNYKQQSTPFNITRHEEEKFNSDLDRFLELLPKYKNNIDEVLEFANLYKRFVHTKNNKDI